MLEMINSHRRLGGSSFCALRSLPIGVPGFIRVGVADIVATQ